MVHVLVELTRTTNTEVKRRKAPVTKASDETKHSSFSFLACAAFEVLALPACCKNVYHWAQLVVASQQQGLKSGKVTEIYGNLSSELVVNWTSPALKDCRTIAVFRPPDGCWRD